MKRQIAQLEEKLGPVPFERSQQRIRLKRGGRTCQAETRALLTHASRLESLGVDWAAATKAGSATLIWNTRCIRVCCRCAVRRAEAAQVLNDPTLLAMPKGHPQAEKTITPADFAEQRRIGVMHKESALRHDTLIAACAKAGFTPKISLEATEPPAALGLVAAGLGVTTVQQRLRNQAPEGVVPRELSWLSDCTLQWPVWHKINLLRLVEDFRKTLVQANPGLAIGTRLKNCYPLIQRSLYYRIMNEDQIVSALGALAHAQRLRVFRALVVAGLPGLTPSTLADQLAVARNTLSFHLKELSHAGLVTVEQQGRNLIYRADFSQMNGLLGYLTEHCCQGSPCEVSDSGTCSTC